MTTTYAKEIFVVKLGGAGAASPQATTTLAKELGGLVDAGHLVTLVHGGGKQLTDLATRLGLPTEMIGGRRVTDGAQIQAAKMAFAGEVGTDLAARFHAAGVKAVALSGVGGGVLQVQRRPLQTVVDRATGGSRQVDFGWVGDVTAVDPAALWALMHARIIPVVASLGVDAGGDVFNVNADTVAAALAASLGARLLLLTDVGGVYRDREDPASCMARMSRADVELAIQDGTASGGMLPKLAAVASALRGGAKAVHITGWQGQMPVASTLGGAGTFISP